MAVLEQFAWIIEQNWWQDAVLSAGNIFFSLTLIPMLRQPGKPPLLTCIPNVVASLAGAFVFGTLHLWVTAGRPSYNRPSVAYFGVQEISSEHPWRPRLHRSA